MRNPKAHVSIYGKLHALCLLSKHVGLIATHRSQVPSREELNRRLSGDGFGYAALAMLTLTSDQTSAVQKAAAGILLELFHPSWQKLAVDEVVGCVVGRDSQEVRQWGEEVLTRDGHQCTRCGSPKELHAHHIVRWADEPRTRIVLGNGVTLCFS